MKETPFLFSKRSRVYQSIHFFATQPSVLLLPFVLAPAFPGMAWPPFFTPSWAPLLKSWSSASRDPPSAQTPLARRLPCLSSGLHSLVGCWPSTCSCASLVGSEKPPGSPPLEGGPRAMPIP